MNKPIKILDNYSTIELTMGKYSLKVLGGWKVSVNNFSIILREIGGDIEVRPKEGFWKVQSFAFGKRAKKIGIINIPKKANYQIELINPTQLKVKESNLFFKRIFQKYLSTNEIQIYIE